MNYLLVILFSVGFLINFYNIFQSVKLSKHTRAYVSYFFACLALIILTVYVCKEL